MKCNYFNEPWLTFTGRTLEQEVGDGWTEGLHPDDYEYCLNVYTSAFKKRESFDMEYRIRHNSGEYRWISDIGTPRYDSKNIFIGYLGFCLDINDRKKEEKEILENEELFEHLFLDHSAVKLILDPLTGKIIDANYAAQEFYGWDRNTLKSMNINDINYS
jgi:PAS domain S-box-containing protein